MELLTPPCAVLLSRILQPVIVYQHKFYWLEVEAGGFVSASAPIILDQSGEPITLAAELTLGSIVRVHAFDGFLRTIQVIRIKRINPFAMAAE